MISILDNCFVVAVSVCFCVGVCLFVRSFVCFVCLLDWLVCCLISYKFAMFSFFLSFGPFFS